MDLEERLQALLIERQETLTTMAERLQQIQYLLLVLAQQNQDERRTIRIRRFF